MEHFLRSKWLDEMDERSSSRFFEEIGVVSGPPTNIHLNSSRVPCSMNDGGFDDTNQLFQSPYIESVPGLESEPLYIGAIPHPYTNSMATDAYHGSRVLMLSPSEQIHVSSSEWFKFPQMKETTQYPRSLASNANTHHTTGSMPHESIGALPAQYAEHPINGFQLMVDTPMTVTPYPSPSWSTPTILHPDTSATTTRVKPLKHGRRATEGKGQKKQVGKNRKSRRAKQKFPIIAWESEDGHSKGRKFRNKFAP